MKILIAFHELNSPGGILNHTEDLIAGFKALGHSVSMIEFSYTQKGFRNKKFSDTSGFSQGEILPIHQQKGWLWGEGDRLPYSDISMMNFWKEQVTKKFDLIIWQIPVPTKQNHLIGNSIWPELYNHSTKQLVVIHDGNFPRYYPHLYHIKDKLHGVVCVHPCAYNTMDIDIPRVMILNPQRLDRMKENQLSYSERKKGFLSLQTFKGWKNVHNIVRAIPHMDSDIKKMIAGGGIEHNYMTSKEKCKQKYHSPDGNRIWDTAVESGLEFLGYIPASQRDELLSTHRTLIDASYSLNYSYFGDHFNRVIVEAIMCGAIPIATNYGMSNNREGNGELFKAGKHYVMLPHNASPQEFAQIVYEANNLPQEVAEEIQQNGRDILKNFDHISIAQQYIDFCELKPTGFYNKIVKKKDENPELRKRSIEIMDYFFHVDRPTVKVDAEENNIVEDVLSSESEEV